MRDQSTLTIEVLEEGYTVIANGKYSEWKKAAHTDSRLLEIFISFFGSDFAEAITEYVATKVLKALE